MCKRIGGKVLFNRREINMLHDPYFRIIREEEYFVEIQSLNTGHCWNVFKNQFEAKYKVVLYHKHERDKTYYHQHRKCRTVTEAIEQIKSHDAYVLEQVEMNKQYLESISENSTRHLKVHETSGYKYRPTPTIILKGQWLNDIGFNIDTPVKVVCEGGKIIITVNE